MADSTVLSSLGHEGLQLLWVSSNSVQLCLPQFIYSFVFRREGTTHWGTGVSAYVVMWPPHARWAYGGEKQLHSCTHIFTQPDFWATDGMLCSLWALTHRPSPPLCSSFHLIYAGFFPFWGAVLSPNNKCILNASLNNFARTSHLQFHIFLSCLHIFKVKPLQRLFIPSWFPPLQFDVILCYHFLFTFSLSLLWQQIVTTVRVAGQDSP